MKQVAKGCLGILVGIFLIIALMLFSLTLPKYRDVSTEAPFSKIVNISLTTKKETLILKNPGLPTSEDYTFHLEDGSSFGMDSELETIANIPMGTEVVIDKVEIHTGRVSGTSTPYLFGNVYSTETQENYAFEYSWGDYHSLYEDQPYWTFPLAFWQDSPLTEEYIIKVP